MIYDLSAERVPSSPKVKMAGGKPVLFQPGSVEGVVIHQTACLFDNGGRHENWLARRALKVAAHMTVFRRGMVAWSAPSTWVMHHGNGFNTKAWGLEIEGIFAGTPGQFNPERHIGLEYATKVGIYEALLAFCVRASYDGHVLKYLWMHRQSSENRLSDPGYEICGFVSHLAEELGLELQPEFTVGTGHPLPESWTAPIRGW